MDDSTARTPDKLPVYAQGSTAGRITFNTEEWVGPGEDPKPTVWDVGHIGDFITSGTHYDHFSAHLFRLIRKADSHNRRRLRDAFPDHVAAYEAWERGDTP